ncbi:MAG: MFS transporter [Anaerolineae bacterium]|nr:MAG: MFS transporter [Anaerolineae bacterium]
MAGQDFTRPRRRIVGSLFAMQSLSSAAVIASATVLTIIAADLTGNPALAGVPSAIIQLSMALSALLWGTLWDRMGRRNGLAAALLIGLAGSGLAAAATEFGAVWAFALGIIGIGAMRAGTLMARFVAAEVSAPDARGRAISIVVWAGTVGAVLGPLLVAPSGAWASSLGLNELTGPILITVPLIGLASAVTFAGLRPEPAKLAKLIEGENPRAEVDEQSTRSISQLIRLPGVYVAVITVAMAQAAMIMLMGITALYMRDLGHSLGDISVVFAAHTLGMFAFAPISGSLSDRLGRGPVMIVGTLIIVLSGILAPASPAVVVIAAGLFLLGFGWSFSFVAGSALLSDQLTPTERSKTQGANDMLIGLASGLGSLASGVLYAGLGYWAAGLAIGLLSAVGFAFSTWWTLSHRVPHPAAAD